MASNEAQNCISYLDHQKRPRTRSRDYAAEGLGLPAVAVLIGVLLGGFWVEQRGGFYDQAIWVG